MAKHKRGQEWQRAAETDAHPQQPDMESGSDHPFASLDHHPADQAQENIGYQKLAWYSAPFGSTGVAVLVMALLANAARRIAKACIRVLMR